MNGDLAAELKEIWKNDPEAVDQHGKLFKAFFSTKKRFPGYFANAFEAPQHLPHGAVPFRLYGDGAEVKGAFEKVSSIYNTILKPCRIYV